MNIGQAVASCFDQYATFSGRASRAEFWQFYLFCMMGSGIASGIGHASDPHIGHRVATLLVIAVDLALLPPFLAAGCRRLHDTGRSGWWQLVALTGIGVILLIVFWAQPPKPKALKHAPANADPA